MKELVAKALVLLARLAAERPQYLRAMGIELDLVDRSYLRDIWDPQNPPEVGADLEARVWSMVAEYVGKVLADGWDRYGAPTVAMDLRGAYFAHYEGPKGDRVVVARSKRQAYQEARRMWAKEILEW
ncbi:MAG: hypothetical protein ACK4G4_10155 [Thermus sp.]|uniref:hypothetical protein n=1 Tax=Thermus sp. TaxID=275 RepID=UPI00391BAE46